MPLGSTFFTAFRRGFGTVADDSGHNRQDSFRVVLVPGLGTNLFSVTAALSNEVASLFCPDNPRLESGDVIVPMNIRGVDDTGKITCSITVKLGAEDGGRQTLGEAPDGLALRVETGSLWQRRMGHINSKSLDVLRKEAANGIDYTGDVQDCSACPLRKSSQQPHPMHAVYSVSRAFQIVFVETLGPFTPTVLGGFKYASTFVDQHTKWKKVVLMKDKTCLTDARELFNKGTDIPRSECIHVLRADNGTEFTSAAYRQYCLDIGIQLQFASPNTPQQIGANERAGRMIMNIVRCMLADSTLPSLLRGKLMHTAVYLSKRTPHAALHDGAPYKALYGKDAHHGHLRVVGARAFVHEETHTIKLESRAWEGRLVGYSLDSKSYCLYNAQTSWVRESRNVIFIETTSALLSLDERGFDDGEFTYADQNDMVRNDTTNHSVDALSPNHAVGDPSVSSFSRTSPPSTTVTLGSAPLTLLRPPRMRLRTTALLRLQESALLSRVTVHLYLPHHLPVLLRPVHHPVLRRRLVRRVLDLLQLVLHRGIVPRMGVVHLVVGVAPTVPLRVVHLRGEGLRRVVDVVR